MAQQVLTGEQLVDALADAARAGVDAQLRHDGGLMPPTVHILLEDLDQPYIGCLTCRPFYPGTDAAAAIMHLGVLPAVTAATRLVIVWEQQDLNVALQSPVDPHGSALCVLDAQLTPPTVLHHHPMQLRRAAPGGGPAVIPEWGAPDRIHNPALPQPIEVLLEVWRDGWEPCDGAVVNDVAIRLQSAGYRTKWMQRR